MKRFKWSMVICLIILLGIKPVFAKDTIYSINKYSEEKLEWIEKSYNENHKMDGMIVGGHLVRTVEEEKNKDILILKYKKNGVLDWTYTEETEPEETIKSLNYTYDDENNIDGYLLTIEKDNNSTKSIQFLKLDLKGEIVWNVPSSLEDNISIKKVIMNPFENGYIAIANDSHNSYLISYDKEMNLKWKKDFQEERKIQFLDFVPLKEEGFVLVKQLIEEDNTQKLVVSKVDQEGQNETIIVKELEKQEQVSLLEKEEGFILYGITPEVKLKAGDKSYFVIKYNSLGEEQWESIGEVSIKGTKKIILREIENEKGYYLLYKNQQDSSYEVMKLDSEGLFEKKVKKIINDYYDFENFLFHKDVLYFIGQITCPEDDNCDFDNNSLFLISDEDKVIEVKDNDGTNILLGVGSFLTVIILIFFLRKRQKRKLN